jgi:Secretion system C-terminal sorting domain
VLTFDDNGQPIKCADGSPQTIAPAGLLSSFNGQDPAGVWTFRVRDAYSGDSGTINNASVLICTKKATLGTSDFGIADFKLFPNPSNGNFKMEFSSATNSPIMVSVVDLLGRKVYQKEFENTGNFSESIDLKKVTSGVYVLSVEDGNKKQVQKIVVQ